MGLFPGLDRDQAMASLPFLVGKFSGRCLKEAMIILRCRFVLAQVVISRGPQKVADRKFGQNLARASSALITSS